MSSRTIQVTERLHAYLMEYGVREPEVMQRLRRETGSLPGAVPGRSKQKNRRHRRDRL